MHWNYIDGNLEELQKFLRARMNNLGKRHRKSLGYLVSKLYIQNLIFLNHFENFYPLELRKSLKISNF